VGGSHKRGGNGSYVAFGCTAAPDDWKLGSLRFHKNLSSGFSGPTVAQGGTVTPCGELLRLISSSLWWSIPGPPLQAVQMQSKIKERELEKKERG